MQAAPGGSKGGAPAEAPEQKLCLVRLLTNEDAAPTR